MRVAVTGAGGLLGATLVPLWRRAGADVVAWSRADLDVTDAAQVREAVASVGASAVVHCAAWTAVDDAETAEAEAMRVNRDGAAAVAEATAAAGATLAHISTDYVFDGRASVPITPGAAPAPLGAYARSKAAGEEAVRAAGGDWLIVRTGWMYGPTGPNFVDAMRRSASRARAVRVVDDQVGAPTSARLVADALWGLLAARARGAWHVAAAGETTWYGVARAVYEDAQADPALVTPCTTAALGRPAPRPAWAVLDCRETERLLGAPMPGWREQLRHYMRHGALDEGLAPVVA